MKHETDQRNTATVQAEITRCKTDYNDYMLSVCGGPNIVPDIDSVHETSLNTFIDVFVKKTRDIQSQEDLDKHITDIKIVCKKCKD